MNLTKTMNIILIFSLLLFLPVVRPSTNVDLVPFRPKEVVVNIQSQSLLIQSDTTSPISLNISYLDTKTNELEIVDSIKFIEELVFEIDLGKQGNYLFVLTSTVIAQITFNEQGIPLTSFFVIGIVLVIRIILMIKSTYTVNLTY